VGTAKVLGMYRINVLSLAAGGERRWSWSGFTVFVLSTAVGVCSMKKGWTCLSWAMAGRVRSVCQDPGAGREEGGWCVGGCFS
jgi:hypothetical protein